MRSSTQTSFTSRERYDGERLDLIRRASLLSPTCPDTYVLRPSGRSPIAILAALVITSTVCNDGFCFRLPQGIQKTLKTHLSFGSHLSSPKPTTCLSVDCQRRDTRRCDTLLPVRLRLVFPFWIQLGFEGLPVLGLANLFGFATFLTPTAEFFL